MSVPDLMTGSATPDLGHAGPGSNGLGNNGFRDVRFRYSGHSLRYAP